MAGQARTGLATDCKLDAGPRPVQCGASCVRATASARECSAKVCTACDCEHRPEAYAAMAAGGSCAARISAGGRNPVARSATSHCRDPETPQAVAQILDRIEVLDP